MHTVPEETKPLQVMAPVSLLRRIRVHAAKTDRRASQVVLDLLENNIPQINDGEDIDDAA